MLNDIDPVCLAGVDYEAVLVTVKAETITDIPFSLAIKNHCSSGSFADITIVDFEDLAPGSGSSSGLDLGPIPEAYSSGDDAEEPIHLEGGEGYADAMVALGVPPPLVPQGEPHSAAPAASLVAQALAKAPPVPLVCGTPIISKPAKVGVKLRLGFFDVLVEGVGGEKLFFRLPLRPASSDPGCKGLLVANFASASVGLVNSIALVGPLRRPTLSVSVLARSPLSGAVAAVPLEEAQALVLGLPAPSPLPSVDAAGFAAPAEPLPVVSTLALDASPVRDTLWHAPPDEEILPPRRCSRFAGDTTFVSIIDKAVQRKKALNKASGSRPLRRGELVADDLLAVAVEDGKALAAGDVGALASACDLPLARLGLGAASSSTVGTP
ncbi:hypothetical protein QYE76_006090 [Lolium multiflorum]|uniref:Uncharacterized protein n=1 Tax=Lolium multiflorum TaxID=4521 RepID=A0AAD8RU84_LOLMU|nr:hypothetical protein QYE76_006090 [Lolium multiflorum]